MTTVGYLFVLGALLLIRQVSKGRAANLPGDLSDAFLAITRGDSAGLTAVLAKTGDSDIPNASIPIAGKAADIAQSVVGKALLDKAESLGKAARGYRLGAVGPDYYDCSGLVWAAMKSLGFKGSRFYTGDVQSVKQMQKINKSDVAIGDIVLWTSHHMGIVSGDDMFYSARSVRSGIGESKISTFGPNNKWAAPTPIYFRYNP